MTPRVEILGIRHHGPGSARSVARALDELAPTAVLIEGAPELDAIVPLAASDDLIPPVAGLVYVVDEPRRASFYPFAVFSPEWVALRWALGRGVDVRFADLPGANLLALRTRPEPPDDVPPGAGGEPDAADGQAEEVEPTEVPPADRPDAAHAEPVVVWDEPETRPDPIAVLASLAGYDDAERWWEDAIEHRGGSSNLERFAALRESMAEVRAAEDERDAAAGTTDRPHRIENLRREAAMRKVLRAVMAAGHERIAFVCGAYHAPALDPAAHPPATHDARALRSLPRVKVATTWAPWTAGRLASSSGYGAGVTAPGWYEHLFTTTDAVVESWLVRVAAALRTEQIDASPASVVEATRLAGALAVVRGRPSVGLSELNDATQAVLCDGSSLPLRLITEKLIVGDGLGSVPAATPMVPLAADLARQQRSLRLKPTAAETVLTVDLRKESQLARSVLFHRLALLGIDWAVSADTGRTTGTFKEAWRLEWRPELAVALIEASVHGTTVESAAVSKVAADAATATDLAGLAELVEACLLAELGQGVADVVALLEARTAQHHDTLALLATVEPLARTCRYGNVRGVDMTTVRHLLGAVVVRASIGLRTACAALDDDGAAAMRSAIEAAQRGVTLLDTDDLRQPWARALSSVADRDDVHGSVSGRVNRLLLDGGLIDVDGAGRRLSRRLSVAADAGAAADWLDGFLAGEAVLLLHDPDLLATIDRWVAGIDDDTFEDLLPLLRRTFARFERPERRRLGEHLRRTGGGGARATRTGRGDDVDLDRARPAMVTVARLLGLVPEPASSDGRADG